MLFLIWLCGGLPAIALALECRPHSIVEWLTALALVIFWPLAMFAFFVAMMRGED